MKANSIINSKRKEIDEIDKKLLKLLLERFNLANEIGIIKKDLNLDNYDSNRENDIFESILNTLNEKSEKEKSKYILEIYKTILKESKLFQLK